MTRVTRGLLRAGWPGTRVLKSAIASGVAWWAATRFGDPVPMFAVFGALNGVQPTISSSLRLTGGALLGIVLGSGLAVLSETFVVAPRAIMVALLVGLGLLIALRLHAYALLGTEVAVTGLLVFALSQGNLLWAAGRFGETALGGGIAILINALLLPPDYREDARHAIETLVQELHRNLCAALSDAARPAPPELAAEHMQAARAATLVADNLVVQVARAREALRFSPLFRYSPFRRTASADIRRYVRGVETLAYAVAHTRSAARAAAHLGNRPAPGAVPAGDWDTLIAEVARAITEFGTFLLYGDDAGRNRASAALCSALHAHARVVAARSWDLDRAAVLAQTQHILDDLRHALSDSAASASG